jgi:hypothetical protein
VTQHEYVFVAVSIILGLAITRLLHTVAMLVRAHQRLTFHWASALWALLVLAYVLQLWWVGWGLRNLPGWSFIDFITLVIATICIYGAAEMALPVPGEDSLDLLEHNRGLGRLSALSMLAYFALGPYLNLAMIGNPMLPSIVAPAIGVALTGLIIALPRWYPPLSLAFATYTALIVYVTT